MAARKGRKPATERSRLTSSAPNMEQLLRHARAVDAAMDKLPPGVLHPNRENAIRRNLSVITDGQVGKRAAAKKSPKSRKPRKGAYVLKADPRRFEWRGGN